jgi:hypothetical protein|tara:strand:+ start:94 stop:201 length:108 start_codon:yes stop_codon:yes gene_type:complete
VVRVMLVMVYLVALVVVAQVVSPAVAAVEYQAKVT